MNTNDEPERSVRDLMIEGIASQMRRNEEAGHLAWWHLIDEEERNRWRRKARSHIEQVGW